MSKPIAMNAVFFVTMYVLGVLCALLTLPDDKGAKLYDNLFLELFLDVYLACVVLAVLPRRLRLWMRRALYVLLYGVAIIDVYCFWKFDSTLTPTMLLLVGETDSREAGEFLRSYLSPEVLISPIGWIFLLIVLHAMWTLRRRIFRLLRYRQRTLLQGWWRIRRRWLNRWGAGIVAGLAAGVLVVAGACTSWRNKVGMTRLMTAGTIGEVEHLLTAKEHGRFYLPVYRLAFSAYSNHLASQQVMKCIEAVKSIKVDSCSYRSPNVVLIIGESYGRHHSQQYGYRLKTTPRQVKREASGMLTKFTDVVSCWNLTSFVFKNFLSLHTIGQAGEWCDYPLFPELYRKAGYKVTFLTNQFLPKAKEAVYDFSGGFFLNNPTLNEALFDLRNDKTHRFDEGLLNDYDTFLKRGDIRLGRNARGQQGKVAEGDNNLIIFHLIGQHVTYRSRCPNDRRKFVPDDYEEIRPELSKKKRRVMADYDNAVLYNDSIVDAIIRRFEHEDAIVIYMPDHGEECYEPGRDFICRNHSDAVDWPLAHYEFEIPFWIWCSHKYAVNHPEVFKAIKDAKDRRFMTDALPHAMLWLGGIAAKDYHAEYNLLSPDYDEMRPRILKNTVDYDALRDKGQPLP